MTSMVTGGTAAEETDKLRVGFMRVCLPLRVCSYIDTTSSSTVACFVETWP